MKLEPSSRSEVYLLLAIVSIVLAMQMATFTLLGR
jgi:hypothetical protein